MSIEIRDAAVSELDNICPSDPNIADTIGMDIMGIADQAKVSFGNVTFRLCVPYNCISDQSTITNLFTQLEKKSDLTTLADFIQEGLALFKENLVTVREFTGSADKTTKSIEFWDWEMKLLSAG